MKRRDFITLLGGAAVAWPLAAGAQQPAMPVIGFLSNLTPDGDAGLLNALRQGLAETGYVEGRNVAVEYRWASEQNDLLPELAADLVRRQVAVVTAFGVTAAVAAKAATATIPIVFQIGANPVDVGLVASLNRPGGNVTGVTNLGVEVGPKRLELLHELIPTATVIAALVNPTSPTAETSSRILQAAARVLGLQLHVLGASTERDFDTAFTNLPQLRASGLVIVGDSSFNSRTRLEQLGALALRHAVPTIYAHREFTAAGGVMAYGDSSTDAYRLAGNYTGRILRGEKPADLPVQQSTKVELIINMKAAKGLGLTFPTALLVRADEVIE